MMLKKHIFTILIIITYLLLSCTKWAQSLERSNLSPLILQSEPPVPAPGKASLIGILYSFTGKGPIPNTVFYLIKNDRGLPSILVGPRETAGDIRGISDQNGRIVVNNIPPGNYYLAVWAPYNWIFAVRSERDINPILIKLSPNERLNMGIIYVPWPN